MFEELTIGENPITIPGPEGALEAVIHLPESANTSTMAVLCHPHPLHGGTMNNKVVTTLARTFRDAGVASIRFNYRGVGKSAGSFADAIGETEDCHAVFNFVKEHYGIGQFFLAGFSFGSYVAYRAHSKHDVLQLISVAPPMDNYDYQELPEPRVPWVVVQGDKDEVVSAERVYAWLDSLAVTPTLLRFPEATHFFHGSLVDLKAKLLPHIEEVIA